MLGEEADPMRLLGQELGSQWQLVRQLVRGPLATVFLAENANRIQAVAHVLHPELEPKRGLRRRFLSDARAASDLKHPGIQHIFHQSEDSSRYCFWIAERVVGETMRVRIDRDGPIPVAELLEYLEQLLSALVAAHRLGVVHQALQPDHLLVTPSGQVVIKEFGLAWIRDALPPHFAGRSPLVMGALPYTAPEKARGEAAENDPRLDVYSLGATLFECLSGRPVHAADSEAELLIRVASTPAIPIREWVPGLPPELADLVDRSLSFEAQHRYPNALSMQRDLHHCLRNAVLATVQAQSHTEGSGNPIDRDAAKQFPAPSRTGFSDYPFPGRPQSLGGSRRRISSLMVQHVDRSDWVSWVLVALITALGVILLAIAATLLLRH